jgi:hypothetical protein
MAGHFRPGLSGFVLICLLTGCSVAPWERGNLAKREMSISPSPNRTALRKHVFDSKEASQGGVGLVGGGCGCN